MSPQPRISIVIPIYNEEAILHAAVVDLVYRLSSMDWPYELILAENGSRDRTVEIAQQLSEKHDHVSTFSYHEPNYGGALKEGILRARGAVVICDEIDLCDTDFYVRALREIRERDFDLVVGSKALDRSRDKRPAYRKLATFVLNSLLRVFLGFHGTDTHGLKAFRRDRLLAVIDRCVVEKDLFASEFVIRAERMDFRMTEIPVTVVEKRPPTINLARRVPSVLKNLGRLVWVIRIRHR